MGLGIMRFSRCILSFLALIWNGAALADCENVIAFSRVIPGSTSSKAIVSENVRSFCNEYRRSSGKSGGASAGFLGVTLGASGASNEEIATRYCSFSQDNFRDDEAYRSYIEAISPEAYAAYRQCVAMSSS